MTRCKQTEGVGRASLEGRDRLLTAKRLEAHGKRPCALDAQLGHGHIFSPRANLFVLGTVP